MRHVIYTYIYIVGSICYKYYELLKYKYHCVFGGIAHHEISQPCHKKVKLFDTLRDSLTPTHSHLYDIISCFRFSLHISACWFDHMTFVFCDFFS